MALQELPHDDDHHWDQEELEEAVARRGHDHAEKPSYHADHHKGPQHGLLLFPSWAASTGVGAEGERRRCPGRLRRPPSRVLSRGREHSHLRA
jgi:hypothetical protein